MLFGSENGKKEAIKNMRIPLFIAHMGIGGAERVCVNLANEWNRLGHEVHISVLNLDNDINTHLLNQGIQVHSLGVSRLRYAFIPMLKYIKKYQPKFMFVFGNEMAVILNKMKQLHLISTPLIVRVLNNVEITLSKDDNISPIVEKYLKNAQKQLRDMHKVIAQCQGMETMLLKNKLVNPQNLLCIYNPVSGDLVEKTEKIRIPIEKRNPNREKQMVFIGRLEPQKNLTHLLQAFAKVYQKQPSLVLHLYGEGGQKEKLEKLAQDLGIFERISFKGTRKDMEQVYAAADMVVLSSEYEGMPNCLIEAIGCGVPVVSYDCPLGPKEIIVDGVNGYLVEYQNIEALAVGMEKCLSKVWKEDEIKATAEKFDVTYIAKKYLEIFEAIS